MKTNIKRFIANPQKYFSGSYKQFAKFGGPSIYFHYECLRAGKKKFLSDRHIEMLYATLVAWGMHRMGDSKTTKTKLTEWKTFRNSFIKNSKELRQFRRYRMLGSSETEYEKAVFKLKRIYKSLKLSGSDATIVVNSKAFHHLFPDFIPPIDRQHTIRFFRQPPEEWRDKKGKFRTIQLPTGVEVQFKLFCKTCVDMKNLADKIKPSLFNQQRKKYKVTPPKALDNAIVNYVKIIAGQSD
jgi:hypothetical protein